MDWDTVLLENETVNFSFTFGAAVRNVLDKQFPGQWMGKEGPIN
jgi:hypothetical protein